MADTSLTDLPPDLRRLHTRGVEAYNHSNLDYAISLLSQVLDKAPSCYDARATLRQAQQRKFRTAGTGLFKKLLSGASSSPQIAKGRLALNSNALDALQIAEQILNSDPNNSLAHRLFADAALAAEMPRAAALSLEVLYKNSPNDKKIAVEFAENLARSGNVDRGEKILLDICRVNPGDPALGEKLKNISALRTMGEAGYEQLANGQGSYRDILRDKEQAVSLEQANRLQKTEDVAARLIAEYEARLPAEPHNQKLLRSLAELCSEKKLFQRSLEYYGRLKSSEGGNDPSLDRAIALTTVRQFEHRIAGLTPDAPDHAEQVARLQADKLAYQVSECRSRVDRYPTDLLIRFEMGTLYFQAGKINEAIQEFQKAQANPHKRIAALGYLAQCFATRKMYDLAARTLQNAIKEKAVFDEEKKELIYHFGCVLESMGKKEDAIEQFKIIYETDIGYRDIAAKVDAYYAGQ